MNTDIFKCTTQLQSERLINLGLSPDTSDMWYDNNGESICGVPELRRGYSFEGLSKLNIPCWSLAAMYDIIKTCCGRCETTLRVDKRYNIFTDKGGWVYDKPLFDAVFEMVCILLEKGVIK